MKTHHLSYLKSDFLIYAFSLLSPNPDMTITGRSLANCDPLHTCPPEASNDTFCHDNLFWCLPVLYFIPV